MSYMKTNEKLHGLKKSEDKWLCSMMWAIGFVLFVMLLSAFLIFKCINDWGQRGQFGDLFGVVNALFSGLAFAGLIITIRQQHQDLEYQRQEIIQTQLELQNQIKEFDEQNETLRVQRFENTFFKMLEVQQSIVNDLYAADSHKEKIEEDDPNNLGRLSKEVLAQDEYRGRNLFYYVFCRCKHDVEFRANHKSNWVFGLFQVIKRVGKSHFDDYFTTSMFDHYFRHLYTILKFINENDWLGEDKQYKYATLVRATLSRYELVMLYYNGFFHPKMKQMIERYTMLNNLRWDLLPMSLEYSRYLDTVKCSARDLKNAGFSVGDFDYYLTDTKYDNGRYYLSAFYTKEEMDKGLALLDRWREFVKKNI